MIMNKKRKFQETIFCFLMLITMTVLSGAQEVVGYWKFDKKGREFESLEGSSGVATVQPAEPNSILPLVVDSIGSLKQVIQFDGSGNAWISTPAKMTEADFSVELWIKVDANNQDALVLGNVSGIMIMARPKGTLAFFLGLEDGGAQWSYVQIPEAITPDSWLHVMARVSDKTQQLFVEHDGKLLKSQAVTVNNLKSYNWPMTVLGINVFDRSCPFQGRIAALKIYSGALSETDFKKSTP